MWILGLKGLSYSIAREFRFFPLFPKVATTQKKPPKHKKKTHLTFSTLIGRLGYTNNLLVITEIT